MRRKRHRVRSSDLSYEIMIAYERDDSTDELPEAVAEELLGHPHTSNWPCFGVEALDYVRMLEWTVRSLPDRSKTVGLNGSVPYGRSLNLHRKFDEAVE